MDFVRKLQVLTCVDYNGSSSYHVVQAVSCGRHSQLLKVPLIFPSDYFFENYFLKRVFMYVQLDYWLPEVYVIQINRLVVHRRSLPLQEQCVCVVASQISYSGGVWPPHVSLDDNRL